MLEKTFKQNQTKIKKRIQNQTKNQTNSQGFEQIPRRPRIKPNKNQTQNQNKTKFEAKKKNQNQTGENEDEQGETATKWGREGLVGCGLSVAPFVPLQLGL
jgi:hypothetical protein